ncbi:MAG: hypothetical protein H6657_17435 [Ardenticatenaceae bacterium]|nr:hypothetical protein [Ardenticatenaceae bacterium]
MQKVEFDRHNLRRFLIDAFSEDGIRDVCFELNIDFESLPGPAKPGKIRELIIFCERSGIFEELIKVVRSARSEEKIRDFLKNETDLAQKQIESSIDNASRFQSVAEVIDLLFINEAEGVFELEARWTSRFQEATVITQNLINITRGYSENIGVLTSEVDTLKNSKHKPSKQDYKNLAQKQAAILDTYTTQVVAASSSYERVFSEGLIAFLRESTIHIVDFKESGNSRVKFLLTHLITLVDASESAIYGDQRMFDSIRNIPRTTSAIVKAKRNALSVLENQIAVRSRILNLMNTISTLLTQMLTEAES